MHRTVMRGGQHKYNINEVLGASFQNLISMLEMEKKMESYTFAKLEPNAVLPANHNKRDIHYFLSEYLIAASAAFKEIENPDVTKMAVSETYAQSVIDMVNGLFGGETEGIISIPESNFEFKQLPYQYQGNLKHLVPGFHLLPYTPNNYNTIGEKLNPLLKAINYLYYFIALLDLNDIKAGDVIDFLRQDKIYFYRYVHEIHEIMIRKSGDYFLQEGIFPADYTQQILKGIERGLEAIAYQIINDFKTLTTVPAPTSLVDPHLDELKDINKTANQQDAEKLYSTYIQKLGISGTEANNLAKELYNIFGKSVTEKLSERTTGVDVNKIASINDDQRRNYTIDSLLNPLYMNVDRVKNKITAADLVDTVESIVAAPGVAAPGVVAPGAAAPGARSVRFGARAAPAPVAPTDTKVVSLKYLYGPPDANEDLHLTSETTQGDQHNANFVDQTHVKIIYDTTNDTGIIKALTEAFPSFSYVNNENRIIILSWLLDYIVNDRKIIDYDDDSKKQELRQLITDALTNYRTVAQRINKINRTEISKHFKNRRYDEAFIREFIASTSRELHLSDTGKLASGAATDPDKNNLGVEQIRNFYRNVVLKNKDFYGKFFNLIRMDNNGAIEDPDADLGEAENVPDSELKRYRLNVRKNKGYSKLIGGQRGGQPTRYGDIVLVTYIPDYPAGDPSVLGLWLTREIYIPQDQLIRHGAEAVRDIVRYTYQRPQGSDTVTIYGHQVPSIEMISRDITVSGFRLASSRGFIKRILDSIDSDIPDISSMWRRHESELSEHMLRHSSLWERDLDGNFVLKDENGKKINSSEEDSCSLINETTQKCFDFFSQCLGQTGLQEACIEFLDFKFDINPSVNKLKEEVMKINPLVAFAILNKFKFGSYLVEEESDPFPGFRRFKVQSVGSWLEELGVGGERCREPQAPVQGCPDDRPLREQLGERLTNIILSKAAGGDWPFLNYLDILVQWVNANPQVLNREEEKEPPSFQGSYPPINPSFNTYSYLNPHKSAYIKVSNLSCELARLKSTVLNDMTGANAPALISSITSTPLGIQMPFSVSGFTSSYPSISMQMGGNTLNSDTLLKDITEQTGYVLFKQLYDYLNRVMRGLNRSDRIRLSSRTAHGIESKLEKLRIAEKELRKSLVAFIKKNQLYQASRGYVNPYPIDDNKKLAAVLSKHSNLVGLSAAYNKRAINLIDMFQTITGAILNKASESGKYEGHSHGEYKRPMSIRYPSK